MTGPILHLAALLVLVTAGSEEPPDATKPRVDRDPAALPIVVDPPDSIEALWARLKSPDFVLLRGDRYRELLKAGASGAASPIEEPFVSRVAIRGEVGAKTAALSIEFVVANPGAGERWASLGLDGLVPSSVTEGGAPRAVRPASAGGLRVSVVGAGEHPIVVAVAAPVVASGEERRLSIPIPPAASTTLALTLDDPTGEATLGPGEPVLPRPIPGRPGVRLDAVLSPRSRVDLSWRLPPDRSTTAPALLTSQGEIAVDVAPDSIRSRARWSIAGQRGEARELVFRFDSAEEFVELDLDGRPVPVEVVPDGESSTIRLALAEPIRQGGPPRSVTLTTRRRLDPSMPSDVTLRGFALADAAIQTGAISVAPAGPIWVEGSPGRGLRRIDPANELPSDLRSRPGTHLAYRFVEQPFELGLRVEPSSPRAESRARTTVVLTPGLATAEARFDLRTTPGRVFDLRFRVPAGLTTDPIEADEAIESSHISADPGATGGPSATSSSSSGPRVLTVRLTAKARESGAFTIRVASRQDWSPGEDVRLGLVEPIGVASLGGRVALLRSPGVAAGLSEADESSGRPPLGSFGPDVAPNTADWSWPADRPDVLEPGVRWYRQQGRPGALRLNLSLNPPSYRSETDLRATVGRLGVSYVQTTRVDAVDGLIPEVEVDVPSAVDPDWTVEGRGVVATGRQLVASRPDGARRYRLSLEKGPARSVALTLRFRTMFATPLGGNEPRSGRLVLIRPVPEAPGPIRLATAAEPGVTLSVDPAGWETRLADPSTPAPAPADPEGGGASTRLVAAGPVAELPAYSARAGAPVSLPALVVVRADLRTVRGGDEQRTVATYRLESHGPEVRVGLPRGARWVQVRVGDAAIPSAAATPAGGLGIPLGTGPASLTLEYAIAASATGAWAPPTLDGAIVRATTWEVTLPEGLAVVGVPRGWSDENEWYFDRYYWRRRPRSAATDGPPGAGAGAGPSGDGHAYRFGRVDGPGLLPVWVVSRVALVGASSGAVALFGIGMVLARPRWRRGLMGLGATAVAVGLALDLDASLQVLQSGAVGALLSAVAVGIQRRTDRRTRRPRGYSLTAPSSSGGTPTGSGLVAPVGSDDSTAIRSRPGPAASTGPLAINAPGPPPPASALPPLGAGHDRGSRG